MLPIKLKLMLSHIRKLSINCTTHWIWRVMLTYISGIIEHCWHCLVEQVLSNDQYLSVKVRGRERRWWSTCFVEQEEIKKKRRKRKTDFSKKNSRFLFFFVLCWANPAFALNHGFNWEVTKFNWWTNKWSLVHVSF